MGIAKEDVLESGFTLMSSKSKPLLRHENNILFWSLATLVFFIYHLTVKISLTQYQKIIITLHV